MKNIIFIVLCSFIVLSCINKKSQNTETSEYSGIEVLMNEEPKEAANIIEYTSNEMEQEEITQKGSDEINRFWTHEMYNFSAYKDNFGDMYRFWTLGNRYTTILLNTKVNNDADKRKEIITFIYDLDGFSNVVLTGEYHSTIHSFNRGAHKQYDTIYLYYSSSLRRLGYRGMDYGTDYYFNNSDGIITLLRSWSTGYDNVDQLEIQYSYQEDELDFFNYIIYNTWNNQPTKHKIEEIIHLDKMIILKDDKGNESMFINEDRAELQTLYINELRKVFFDIIEYLDEKGYREEDLNFETQFLPELTKNEKEIFEECVYEYFTLIDREDIELIDNGAFVFLNVLKGQ